MHRNVAVKGNDSSEDSQRKEESWRSFCLFREYVNNHQKNVNKIWMVKAILVTAQRKMRNILWDNGGKVILLIKSEKNLAELYFSVLWKVKLASY